LRDFKDKYSVFHEPFRIYKKRQISFLESKGFQITGENLYNPLLNPVIPLEEIVKNSTFLDNLFNFLLGRSIFLRNTRQYMYSIFMPVLAVLSIMTEGGIGVFYNQKLTILEKSYDDSKKIYVPDHRVLPPGIHISPAGCFR